MQYATINPVTGQRLINGAWVGAQTALAILQVRVLFQALATAPRAWQHEDEGFLIAELAIAWLLGSTLGKRWSTGPNAGYWSWRTLFLSATWVALPRLSMNWPHLTGVPSPLVPDLLFALLALLLGLCGSAWMAAARPQWPAASEGIQQATDLCGIPLALVVVYLWADWSGWVALTALVPLLVIDSYPFARCPFPLDASWPQGQRLRRQAIDEEWLAATSISIDRRSLSFGWWWRWLSRYSHLPLTLLVSFVTIVLSAVWWVVPTAFAWELLTHRQLAILVYLVGGQVVALALAAGLLLLNRHWLGRSDRLIPKAWRDRGKLLAAGSLLVLSCSLVALGVPWWQNGWQLGLSLGVYTMAAACWARLVPRLLPSLAVMRRNRRPLQLWQPLVADLAQVRKLALDTQARRALGRFETGCTCLAIPLAGVILQQLGVDGLLRAAGLLLLFLLVLLGALGTFGAPTLAARSRQPSPVPPSPTQTMTAVPAASSTDEHIFMT